MFSLLILLVAGFGAGLLNAVAGGGTFLTFPALVWLGLPPLVANATATLTALPGYVGSAWAYREDVGTEGALALRGIVMVAAIGGLGGAALILVTPSEVFSAVVPWLLLFATLVFAAGPRLMGLARGGGQAAPGRVASGATIFAVAAYGGYFNGGLGIMLLAAFGLIGFVDLHGMNGLKNLLSALLSVVSVATFSLAGLVAWDSALVMASACAAGGYVGARLARRIRRTYLLRAAITAIGLAMSAAFFVA